MKDVTSDFQTELAGLERDDWFTALDDLAEEYGHFEPIGADHGAAFIDAGPKLLVTFESYPEIVANSERAEPRGFTFVRAFGWSHLAIVAKDEGWFRDKRMFHYFDRLIDDGFFEDFEQVLFYGVHRGGYAACAYSVAAPGARVLALRPTATLSPRHAGWDQRYRTDRRLDFTSRYGYAPDMIEATDRAYIIHDPQEAMDDMQASLFTRPNVTALRMPMMGQRLDHSLSAMGVLRTMVETAMNGTLSEASFARLYRERRSHLPYLRNLVTAFEQRQRLEFAARVCRYVLAKSHRPHFARRLREIEDLMKLDG